MSRKIYEGTKQERMKQASQKWKKLKPLAWKRSQRNSKMKKKFGISEEEYNKILVQQKGVCGICQSLEAVIDWRTKERRQLAVDHDHITGKVRGLLCTNCNHGLGKFQENMDLLQKAIDYLELS